MRQSTNSVFERWEMSINYQFSTCILVTSGGVQVYPPLAAAGMVPVWLPAMAGQGSMSTLPRTRRQLETNNSDISVNNIQWKCLLGRLSCWPFINVKIEEPYRQEVGRCHPDPYIRTPPPVFAITISQRWRCWRLLGGDEPTLRIQLWYTPTKLNGISQMFHIPLQSSESGLESVCLKNYYNAFNCMY